MQGGSTGIGYGLKYQVRCITIDVKTDTESPHQFHCQSTLSLKEENRVHLIRSFHRAELVNSYVRVCFASNEDLGPLLVPYSQRIFSTVFSYGESYGAAIWQIPELYGQLNSPQLERIGSLMPTILEIKCTLWWPSGRHDKLISIDEQNLYLWSLDSSKRQYRICSEIQVTAEDESGIHIWDLRMLKVPILELPGHAHWTWAVRCNPSAGTDSAVNLWMASPPSSDDLSSESLMESHTRSVDPLLNSDSDYEDSVYGGRGINKAPSFQKMKSDHILDSIFSPSQAYHWEYLLPSYEIFSFAIEGFHNVSGCS
ncbi:WD repeat-containing protein DWA2 [Camellia lanceoleosa]|uniref:WD repeat-containing protein DWA2 n=1 Tax=Camellia lanceoleosa TaxID=1840588 RepID=A0ACC0HTH8_9ERIC|nr:WD repeat-containing protein DWA2 [Camellia lanceoleosa]